jgi:hypothetical protein
MALALDFPEDAQRIQLLMPSPAFTRGESPWFAWKQNYSFSEFGEQRRSTKKQISRLTLAIVGKISNQQEDLLIVLPTQPKTTVTRLSE